MLHADFETRSWVDLISQGAHVYATDPTTEVLMLSHGLEDTPIELWTPEQPFPSYIKDHIHSGGMIAAFNAQFERLIFWYVLCNDFDVPVPKLEQFYCVAAQSRANNLPGNLEDCARFIGGRHQKDRRGKELIKLFCIPTAHGTFNDGTTHPAEWAEFCQYCIDDTEAERDISKHMRPLTQSEQEDYWANEHINERGLLVDRDLAVAAQQYANAEQSDLIERIKQLTNRQILKARGKFITQWVYESLPDDDVRRHMHVYKGGEQKLTFDKNARERLLSEPEIVPHVREVIECSDFAQASSTGKFLAMEKRADPDDDRVRCSYILNGAGSTGRYSARGLQTHNLPRKGYEREIADEIRRRMLTGATREQLSEASGDSVMQTLKGLLRYAVRAANGNTFVCGDLEQIEGRVNPWLAMGFRSDVDQHALAKLAIYADPSRDVYCETASDILHRPITKQDSERQGYGKVPELSLGFGGGAGAFLGMAHNYGVSLERAEVDRIVKSWRASNRWAQPFWYKLFDSAVKAIHEPNVPYAAGRVKYLFTPEFLGGTLWCLLPGGRLLSYPQARAEWKENKFGELAWQLSAAKAAWKPKADETEWPRVYLWPGLLCENVTQAAAADVLRDMLYELVYEYDAPVCGHTHDEALLEVLLNDAEKWAAILNDVMVTGPEWAAGLPLAAEIWTGDRYRK